MGRLDARSTEDYQEIDQQIMATKRWIQHKILGIEEGLNAIQTSGGGYFEEIARRCHYDPIAMFSLVWGVSSDRLEDNILRHCLMVLQRRHLQIQQTAGLSYG